MYVESLNKLKSLSQNPNVPEECFDDFEICRMEMVELLKRKTLVDHELTLSKKTTHQKIRENI